MSPSTSHLHAIGFALVGFAVWVLGDTSMKLAGDMPMPKYEIAMIGSLGGMVVVFLITLLRGKIKRLRPKRPRGLAIQGLLNTCNYLILVWLLPRLPLANFYTFTFLMPMTIAVLAAVFLHEHLDWKRALAIAAGFGGVVIAVNPGGMESNSNLWLVYGAAFVFMLTNALQMLMLRILGPDENRECLAFYPRGMALAVTIAAGLLFGFKSMPVYGLLYALASGACGGIGWLCMAQAYKLAPAATVAPFHYSQLVIGTLLGYLIWKDVPTMHVLAGAAIIIASGVYIAMHARKAGIVAKLLEETPEM